MIGIKFGDLVLSIVESYLIQCPFLGVSSLRDSTVVVELNIQLSSYQAQLLDIVMIVINPKFWA